MLFFHFIFGAAFLGAGAFMYVMLGSVPWAESGLPDMGILAIRYGAPGIFLLIGGISAIQFVGALAAIPKKRRMANALVERGIETTGQITYVDRNWQIKVNERPIYSIIEYVFEVDGEQYIRRKNDVPTEIAIRAGFAVGQTVPVYYLPEDPDNNMLLIGSEDDLNRLRAKSKRKAH